MKILGIETATMRVGVALLDETGLVAEYRLEATRSRTERLMPMIDRVLKDGHCPPQDLNGLAVSIGPGSFTGLRVGVSTAKGLAFSLGIPAVGISTLKALAASAAIVRSPYPICPMIDAKRQEVYAALFRVNSEGGLDQILEGEACPPSVWIDKLSDFQESILFIGTGALLYESVISGRLGEKAILISRSDPYPLPSRVAELGMKRLASGAGDDASSLSPVYLSRFSPKPAWKS